MGTDKVVWIIILIIVSSVFHTAGQSHGCDLEPTEPKILNDLATKELETPYEDQQQPQPDPPTVEDLIHLLF